MIVNMTWRSVGSYTLDNKEDYEINEYRLEFNSRTRTIHLFKMKLLNEVTEVLFYNKFDKEFDTYKGKENKKFEEYCEEWFNIFYSIGMIEGRKIDKNDGGYSYRVVNVLLLDMESPHYK